VPLVYKITVQGMPPDAFFSADERQRFRNIVGGRLRRWFQRLRQEASQRTLFAEFKDYFIEQKTEGNNLSFAIGNRNPFFQYMEEPTRQGIGPSRFPNWRQGSRLADWAGRHGVNPFLAARHVFRFGTRGHRILQTLWDQSAEDLNRTINDAVDAYMRAYAEGNPSVGDT